MLESVTVYTHIYSMYVQQRSADEVMVCLSQVVKKKREGSDCRCSHNLIFTLQHLGKQTHTPRLTHTTMKEGQQPHTVCLDIRCWKNTRLKSTPETSTESSSCYVWTAF